MKTYSFTEARQKLAEVLDLAKDEDVVIQRRGGESFVLSFQKTSRSPLDIPGVGSQGVTTKDIIEAVRESRAQAWRNKRK